MVNSSEAVPELLPIFEATVSETGARERSGTHQQLQPAKQCSGSSAGIALPGHLSNNHAATTNRATAADVKDFDSSGGSSCMASAEAISTSLNNPATPDQLDITQSALEALVSRSAAVVASSQPDPSMLSGASPAASSQQQLVIIPISQAASTVADTTVPAALAGSLSALPAPPQAAETAAGTADPAAVAAAQGLVGLTDNSTINAFLLQNGLNLQGNFASTAALSGLLSGMTQAQLESLAQGSAIGVVSDLGLPANLGNLGYGLLGQNPAAAAAAAAADDDDAKSGAQAGNKQLSSRYRGVCWNKKNKRWQAAINSGGKYIYLGSFTSEDDAAKQFDRAAIKIRGQKAKLNFSYSDYVDGEGNLLEDLPLPSGTASKDDRSARSSTGGKSGPGSNIDGDCIYFETQTGDLSNQAIISGMQAGAVGLNGALGWNAMGLTGLTGAKVVRTPAVLNLNDVPGVLPEGCSLDSFITGSDGYMCGVMYKSGTGQGGCGLWTGYKFYAYGDYQNESDARQMLTKSMEMLSDDRQVRAVAIPAAAAAAAAGGIGGAPIVGGKSDGQVPGQTNMTQSQMVGQTPGQSDAFMTALGLGALRPAGVVGGGFFAPVSAAAAAGDSSRVVSTMGNMANYDFAKAQQLVREAVEQQQQQGVSVGTSFPPLTVDLPVVSQAAVQQQQQQQGDIHFVLQQYFQQGEIKQQQQQQPTANETVAKLGVFDVATIHQLIKQDGDLPQQQQQQPAGVNSKPIGGNIGSISVEELLASIGAKPPAAATTVGGLSSTAAVAAPAASSAPYWSNLLALTNATTPPATTPPPPAAAAGDVSAAVNDPSAAAAAAAAEEPAAKRLKLSDQGPPAAAAAAAGGGGGDGSGGTAAEVGLQEAVKQIIALSDGTAS